MLLYPLTRAPPRAFLLSSSLSPRISCSSSSTSYRGRPHASSLPYLPARVFASSPLHRRNVSDDKSAPKPAQGTTEALRRTQAAQPAQAAASKPSLGVAAQKTPKDPLLAEQTVSNKEQRKADWAIIKEMSRYLWPKDDLGTRMRVGLSVGLLVGAKLLNVQVPFYFKSIVDSMNIDFLAVGGTAWTVAGSMVVACKLSPHSFINLLVSMLTRSCFP